MQHLAGQPANKGDDIYGNPTDRNYNRGTGKGSELAQAYRSRCAEVMKEPGCEQFEVFQSVVNPDKLALLERWTDKAALDAHAQLNSTRPSLSPELRAPGRPEREDYEYNRTR